MQLMQLMTDEEMCVRLEGGFRIFNSSSYQKYSSK